jgi:flavorubredoxin
VGSPTFNSQMLPTIAGFLCYMKGLSPKNQGRIAIAFGSYGWAPLAQKQIAAEMESVGFDVRETISENWIPSEEHLAAIRDKVIALAKENA